MKSEFASATTGRRNGDVDFRLVADVTDILCAFHFMKDVGVKTELGIIIPLPETEETSVNFQGLILWKKLETANREMPFQFESAHDFKSAFGLVLRNLFGAFAARKESPDFMVKVGEHPTDPEIFMIAVWIVADDLDQETSRALDKHFENEGLQGKEHQAKVY